LAGGTNELFLFPHSIDCANNTLAGVTNHRWQVSQIIYVENGVNSGSPKFPFEESFITTGHRGKEKSSMLEGQLAQSNSRTGPIVTKHH
jgi:hypothetical protein